MLSAEVLLLLTAVTWQMVGADVAQQEQEVVHDVWHCTICH
jgi:hypothetical protein